MNCVAVREQLTEQALGALAPREAVAVDRHLAWCAACRREADDLNRAAATLSFALSPSEPAEHLESMVVGAVQEAAGIRRPATHRVRTAASMVIAAMVAVSGLGWGAVMAGRADRFRAQVRDAKVQQAAEAQRVAKILTTAPFQDPHNQVFLGTLSPTSGIGGGAAITLVSPSIIDMAIVTVSGLPPAKAEAMPYAVTISDDLGHVLPVGKIDELDSDGAGRLVRNFNRDLLGFTHVVVRDAAGKIVMQGSIQPRAVVASPTP